MPFSSFAKQALAAGGHWSGFSRLGLEWQKVFRMPFIRAINYHDVPAEEARSFESQLSVFRTHFVPVGLEELILIAGGTWPYDRPGLLISFDDGLASHAEVAAPILERAGFPGWFMVPTGFIDTPPADQVAYAREHSIQVRASVHGDGRVAMTWAELRDLSHRHVVGCHTINHVRFSTECSMRELESETQRSRQRLEEQLDRDIEVFAWVGGEEESYSSLGAEMVRKAGFRVGLMTNSQPFRPGHNLLQVQRTNIESSYPPSLTALHISGLYDLIYRAKRRRVESVTAVH